MIYTVTLNPCLDYIVSVEDFTPGKVNRSSKEMILPGGKGVNVSIVLKNLGYESTMLGFTAGFTGREITRLLEEIGCRTDFIQVREGFTRINLKLKAREESEINGIGPTISKEEVEKLYRKVELLKEGDFLILAGSVPASLPTDVYETILCMMEGKKVLTVVDAAKDLLLNALKYRPFLIKPNHHELGELFGVTLNGKEDVVRYAKKAAEKGARNVLTSMAGEGAVFLTEQGTVYQSPAPKGKLINSVGAGDSMVSGFICGYLESGDMERAFKMGIAAGSASAFSKYLATKEEVEELLRQII